ncbi:hypothetical protein GCM10009618_01050 [Nesterenkonia lacusekhoensis]
MNGMELEHDVRLLESEKVRRQRLTDAFVYGTNPHEQMHRTNTVRLMFSILIAALIAAGCVGASFIMNMLEQRQQEREQRENPAAVVVVDDDAGAAAALPAPHSPARLTTAPAAEGGLR